MIGTLNLSYRKYGWANTQNLTWLSRSNFQKILKKDVAVDCYSSLEDLGLKFDNLRDLVNSCNKINMVGIDQYFLSGVDQENLSLYFALFRILSMQPHKCTNRPWESMFSFRRYNDHKAHRSSDGPTLWINGCSFSEGAGISAQDRYGEKLAERLQLPLVTLAQSGSSIQWQADQWLRADVRPGDTAVWGLTNVCRENFVDDLGDWTNITIKYYPQIPKKNQYWNLDYFDSITQAVRCIKNVLQVENYFKKIGVDYYFVNLLDTNWLPIAFLEHPKFLDLVCDIEENYQSNTGIEYVRYKFVDFGNDNLHPGVLQHQKYCDDIYNFILKKMN